MQIQGKLPLFSLEQETTTPTLTTFTDVKINEEQIITPLTELLQTLTPTPSANKSENKNISQSLTKSLNDLFPEQQFKDKDLQKTKETLGQAGANLTEEQVRDVLTEVQFLAATWLDDFERDLFDGLTLQELLHEKGG